MTVRSFTITIDDAGIEYARQQHNDALPILYLEIEGTAQAQPAEDHPDYIVDDDAYVQRVMERAAGSYVQQAVAAGVKLALDTAVARGLSVADVGSALDQKAIDVGAVTAEALGVTPLTPVKGG